LLLVLSGCEVKGYHGDAQAWCSCADAQVMCKINRGGSDQTLEVP
jgi:hypothetical protein